jgi:fibrillarin-like pre-rRNA processing protein
MSGNNFKKKSRLTQARFDNVFEIKGNRGSRFFTKSLYPFRGFEETVIKDGGNKYREVDPERSKLFAAIAKGVSQIGIREGSTVLYLGASHGYTPSYVSDMIGESGKMMCIDVAPRVLRDLVFVCQRRENMAPLIADCRQFKTYKNFVPDNGVDVIFQDISQRDQVDIFLNNCTAYLKEGGFGLLAVKARSIDVSRKPQIIFKEAFQQLEQSAFTIVDKRELEPFEKDHIMFVIKKK